MAVKGRLTGGFPPGIIYDDRDDFSPTGQAIMARRQATLRYRRDIP